MSGKMQYKQKSSNNNNSLHSGGQCCSNNNCENNKNAMQCTGYGENGTNNNMNSGNNGGAGSQAGHSTSLNSNNNQNHSNCKGNSLNDNSLSTNNNNNTCNNNSNNNNSSSNSTKNRICRNFVRGTCRRKHCRYPHVISPEQVVFCHDYQNANCIRMNCKFLHYTLQEEEYYRKYGEFPTEYQIMMNDNGLLPPIGLQNTQLNLHQNKNANYLGNNGYGGSCRHRDCHLPSSQLDSMQTRDLWKDHSGYRIDDRLLPGFMNDDFKSMKRSARDACEANAQYKRYREDSDRCIDLIAVIRRFEEEQKMLRRRVEANEIKIAELRATNEYLVAQSAQLRLSNQVVQQQQQQQQAQQVQVSQQNQQCSTVVNPVTVTQTTTQPQAQQVLGGAVSIAPVQVQATPIVSIATPQTQIITNGGGTPLAIGAANTSQGQQLAALQQNITSLSNTTQTMPPTAQQILGTSQITLTPAIAQGASMGLTINTSQALAMSNATQPNISYPIMTHSILPHCNN